MKKTIFVTILILITITIAGCFHLPTPNVCEDNDGDGYGLPGSSSCDFTAEDCDDNNVAVNPGATEVCNDIDDDCNGQIDEVACGSVCSNGLLESGEECDDGNENGVLCSAPHGGSCQYCDAECSIVTIQGLYCGDGYCNGPENCSSCSADCGPCANLGSTIVINHDNTNINDVPVSCINKAKETLHIAYSHTSHGSQLPTGMSALMDYDSLYSFSHGGGQGVLHFEDYSTSGFGTGLCYDLSNCDDGGEGILAPTRTFLNSAEGQDINVILWSWCAIGGHNIPFYLEKMETLITEYEHGSSQHPLPVKFVFITGHSDYQGMGDYPSFSDFTNRQIRNYIYDSSPDSFCKQHECIFFDFGDMEEYDPDNNFYLDDHVGDNLDYYPGGNWGVDYLANHPAGLNHELTSTIATYYACAHSSNPYGANLNCALKGNAAWYMFARMAGWDGISPTCD